MYSKNNAHFLMVWVLHMVQNTFNKTGINPSYVESFKET